MDHIAAVCKSKNTLPIKSQAQTTPSQKAKTTSTRAHFVETEEVSNAIDELYLFAIGTEAKPRPPTCELSVEGKPLLMEIDTGAKVSIIS